MASNGGDGIDFERSGIEAAILTGVQLKFKLVAIGAVPVHS